MIGNFARMFRDNARVEEVAPATDGQGYEVTARREGDVGRTSHEPDGPPEAFVARVPHDGGDVFVIPFMEAFRGWLRQRRNDRDDATSAEAEGQEKKKKSPRRVGVESGDTGNLTHPARQGGFEPR